MRGEGEKTWDTWLVHAYAQCDDCGAEFNARNAQALAGQHARKYGHAVRGEVGLSFLYSGAKE